MLAFISIPKGPELILIIVVLIFLFGGKKIPELMKGMGRGISDFKKGMKGEPDTQLTKEDKA